MKEGSGNAPGDSNELALTFKDSDQCGFGKFREIDRTSMPYLSQRFGRGSDSREFRQNQPRMQTEGLEWG